MSQNGLRRAAVAAVATLTAAEAAAGAFEIREGSAAAQGASFAGRTSAERDVSFALANPAALRAVERAEITGGLAVIVTSNDGEADPVASAVGARFGLDDDDNPGEIGFVPSFAAGYRLTDELVVGVTTDAPFGLATQYDDEFVGSFDGVSSELITIALTPMASYEIVPGLAVGAGVTVQYAQAELTTRLAPGPGAIGAVEGDDIGVGFTIGALVDVTSTTTLGARFRTGVDHELEGDFTANFPLQGDGSANLDLPHVFNVGVTQEVTDDLRLMVEGEYTNWSQFENITLTEASTGAQIVDPQNYDDSFFVAAGAEYDVSDALTVRGGLAWDETPTTDSFRTVRVPDADRFWFSAGASYEVTESIGVDAAYSFLLAEDTRVQLRNVPGSVEYESNAHIVGVNARYSF